jgi:ubiquinone/menaquinone biosynthesis C-methylase UbiE
MKLNALEKALMNNPVRTWVQRRVEAPLLESLGGRVGGLRALEVGCGRGVGTQIILDHFGAQEVWAFDLDEQMVELARRRLSPYPAARWRLSVGDATSIKAEDASFDAVFAFGILHHVPDWQRPVAEIRRVLRPSGRFFFMEVTSQALGDFIYGVGKVEMVGAATSAARSDSSVRIEEL